MQTAEQIKDTVKEKYGGIAQQMTTGCCSSSCCSDTDQDATFSEDYSQLEGYYAGADLNLGCGVPTQFAQIAEGAVVLDLGSGAGNDVFVARRIVGEEGKVIGVDMTHEMIARAQQNQAKLGYQNVEFRLGEIEVLPVADEEVDVTLSNCVLNLVPDKRKAFQEIYRVLKPGGHFCISDIVLRGELPEKLQVAAALYTGCVAGAMQQEHYLQAIQDAGFVEVDIKTARQITISDAILAQYLNADEIKTYRESRTGILSITVFGKKPNTGE
jgi:ubiquinone/menaquinone biosynthesis C-methylase UbiE